MFFEELFIFPAPRFPQGDWEPGRLEHEDVGFTSADGVRLHGWLLAHPHPQAHAVYFHGNGEHVAYAAEYVDSLRQQHGLNVLLFDYRGYGRSEGEPSEKGVLRDGEAAQRWLAARQRVSPTEIVLVGRSIGGAIATWCAAAQGARGLVLQSTFACLADIVRRHFPWFPASFLRSRFPAIDWIQGFQGPLLMSHSRDDEIAPFDSGYRLYQGAPSREKSLFEFSGLGHNEGEPLEYADRLARFLASLPCGVQPEV